MNQSFLSSWLRHGEYPRTCGLFFFRVTFRGTVGSGRGALLLGSIMFKHQGQSLSLFKRCSMDYTLDYSYNQSAVQRFSIEALTLRNFSKAVYVHCKLTTCQRSERKSICTKGCPYERRRRASEQMIQQHLSVGPLVLLWDGEKDTYGGDKKSGNANCQ